MIHIIGTAHSLQYWSDAIRNGEDCDSDPAKVGRFRCYLQKTARSLGATAIAEELSQELVEERQGGASVAKQVADSLGLRHLFCDPDRSEREAHGILTDKAREGFWASRLELLAPNDVQLIFVCGSDHSDTFKTMLDSRGLRAGVYCNDWSARE